MRLVLDTNILLAAVLAPGLCRELLRGPLLAHELCCSPGLLREFEEKVREKLGVDPRDLPILSAYARRVYMVDPAPLPQPVCRDPDDDLVRATAVTAQARVILTGDADMLVLRQYQGIHFLTPRQFLNPPGG